jgi:HAD superfamily hydrolase (TIGR01509 family)
MSKQIIFDLGAVLFRWEPMALLGEVFADKSPDAQQIGHWSADIFRSFEPTSEWARFDKGLLNADQVAEQIAARTEFSADDILHLIAAVPTHLQLMQKTADLIDVLRGNGYQLYFLSNMPAPFAQHLVRAHDFDRWFIDGIFSAHVNQVKPEPDIFHTAMKRWAQDQSSFQPIFIDDSAKNIATAKLLGWRTIQYHAIDQVKDELTGFGISTTTDPI